MAELIVGALLSASMNVLLESLASKEVIAFFQGTNSGAARKLLEELRTRLISANALVSDAEEKQLVSDGVGDWLAELKDIIYEADRVTDSINTDTLCSEAERERKGKCSTLCFNTPRFRSRLALKAETSKMKGIVGRLKLVLDQHAILGLKPRGLDHTKPYYSHRSLVPPLAREPNVYGRESEREAIVESLMSEDATGPRISVIPIVGMGGIGKTTLAQLVYEDVRVRERFDLRVWVTVSEEFDVLKLTRAILEAVTLGKSDSADLFRLQTELNAVLKGKMFVCVLDDVWNENYQLWDALKSSLESGLHGSKIIVTTRSQIVASKMCTHGILDLEKMADDKCWSLFADHVFGNVDDDDGGFSCEELRKIGTKIVKKCKGLPLAVKAMAGLLRGISDPMEWRSVLESDLWDLQFRENQKNGILPALWLSYRSLSPQLKRCFVYCSMFPKDYEFSEGDQEKLVLLWMAEGLLRGERGKSMEDVGREYVNELIARSLFQRCSRYDEIILLMHDLVHDLAIRVSGEFCFLSYGGDHLQNLANKSRHVSYEKSSEEVKKLEEISLDMKRLRTMVALPLSHNIWRPLIRSQETLLERIPNVEGSFRALSLPSPSVTKLPCSIGNLKHLRYLDLYRSKINELPSSICTLYNLQTLLLVCCEKLKKLPAETSRLVNLRHLNLNGTVLKAMPPNIHKMTNLQTLPYFIVCQGSGSRIKELGDLKLLRGRLKITGIGNVVDVSDAVEAKLSNKKWVDELFLDRGREHVDDLERERDILNALQPNTRLKKLEICGFDYERLPNWVAQHSFVDVTDVTLSLCRCTVLPPFGQLPSLKALSLRSFSKLVSIGDEICGDSSSKPFPRLERLSLASMYSLECWSFTSETIIFPRLKIFPIELCQKLSTGFPSVSLPALESAYFSECPAMVRVFNPTIRTLYPSLKFIKVQLCERVKTLEGIESAPNLKHLKIRDCDVLLANHSSWDGPLQRKNILLNFDIACEP